MRLLVNSARLRHDGAAGSYRAALSLGLAILLTVSLCGQSITWLGVAKRPYYPTGMAYAVSADGRVVVGSAGGAFRWTEERRLEWLDSVCAPIDGSEALLVSADGSTIVG